jgi:hypothetical protein
MSFIINSVFPRYRETETIETKLREFEVYCASKCQNLVPIEFKRWLDNDIDRDVLKTFAARKCDYRTSPYLDIDELYECIDKITEYIYRIYRSNYFTPIETISSIDVSEDQSFADEMVHLLQSMRNRLTIHEVPTSEMMTAALENDIRSAMLFYDVMVSMNSRRETMVPKRKFDIELEEEKEEEKLIECFVCFENISNIKCIKQNCLHECCSTCLIKTINTDKRPEPLCAMCRTPIEKLMVKTIELKNELGEIYK